MRGEDPPTALSVTTAVLPKASDAIMATTSGEPKARPNPSSATQMMRPAIDGCTELNGRPELHQGRNSLEQDDDVEADRPVPHVARIEFDPLGIGQVASATDLPDAGQARP